MEKNETFLMLIFGLVIVAVVVLAPRQEAAPIVVNNTPAPSSAGAGGLNGLISLGTSLLGAVGI